jgi:hypothetical protein
MKPFLESSYPVLFVDADGSHQCHNSAFLKGLARYENWTHVICFRRC